jgi:hypothetical protein
VTDPPIIHLHTDESFQVEVEERDDPDGVTFWYTVREVDDEPDDDEIERQTCDYG